MSALTGLYDSASFHFLWQRWEVTKYKFFVTSKYKYLMLMYFSRCFMYLYFTYLFFFTCPHLLPLLLPFQHTDLTLSKQTHYFSFLMHLRRVIDSFYFAPLYALFQTLQHGFQPISTSHMGDVARWKGIKKRREGGDRRTERQTRMGRKGMLVCRITREPAALCLDFLIFLNFCFYKLKMLYFYILGNETPTVSLVHLQIARRNPIGSTLKLNSLFP